MHSHSPFYLLCLIMFFCISLLTVDCLKIIISKGLGIGIILGSVLGKEKGLLLHFNIFFCFSQPLSYL